MTCSALLLWRGVTRSITIQLSFIVTRSRASAGFAAPIWWPLHDMTPNYSGSLSDDEYLRQYGRRARASPDGTDRNTDRLGRKLWTFAATISFNRRHHLAYRGCRLNLEKESSSVGWCPRNSGGQCLPGDSQSRSCDRLGCSPMEKTNDRNERMTTVFREMLQVPGIITHQLLMTHYRKIAERVDSVVWPSGYALGASSCVPEPLLSLEKS